MRKTIVTCDICGKDETEGTIHEHFVGSPYVYKTGNVPPTYPGKRKKIDAHDECAALIGRVLESAWTNALDEVAKLVEENWKEGGEGDG